MRKLIGILALLLLLTGCAAPQAPELQPSVQASFDTTRVQRGDVALMQVYNASVSLEFVPHRTQVPGAVRVRAAVGQEVSEGELLAEIGTDALLRQKAQLEQELADLDAREGYELRLTEFDLEIAKARAQVSGADTAALALDVRQLEAERDYRAGILAEKKGVLERAKAVLEEQIEKSRIVALCDGTVVSVTSDAQAREGAEILRIARRGSEYLLCTEAGSALARTSAPCFARLEDQEYPVTLIPYTDEEYLSAIMVGTVPARFAFPDGTALQAGEGAQLTVVARQAENALYLPLGAVYGSETSRNGYVYRVVDGEKIHTEVTVAFRTEAWAVIESGLEEGEMVYVPLSS